jgi:hypothetical protein
MTLQKSALVANYWYGQKYTYRLYRDDHATSQRVRFDTSEYVSRGFRFCRRPNGTDARSELIGTRFSYVAAQNSGGEF